MAIKISPLNQGFTLIEVMIATVIGMVITLGLLQVNLYLTHNTAVQNGNSSFEQLVADITLRLSNTKNLVGSQSSVCARTLGTGFPNPAFTLPAATPSSAVPIPFLYDSFNTATPQVFLAPNQTYGNIKLGTFSFQPIAQAIQVSASSDYSLIGKLQITGVRYADLNQGPRPTPTLTSSIPFTIIFNSSLQLVDCGFLTNTSQPIPVPSCGSNPPQFLTQNLKTGQWECINLNN